jgi:gliding motility-associated-like protein
MDSYTYTIYNNLASSSTITPAIADLTPSIVEDCRIITCTPPLEATTVDADEICAGETSTISASGPSDPNVNYTVFEAATGGTSIGSIPLDVSPTETTTYYIETVDNSDPSCVSVTRVPVEVVVNEAPAVNPTSNSPLCIGENLELNTDEILGATYDWSGPNGFTSDIYNPSITDVTVDNDGDYEVTVTANGCTSGPITISVVVVDVPVAEPDAVSTEVCEGEDIELLANEIVGADYSWTGPNGFTSTDQNPIIPNSDVSNDGEYELTITVGSCVSETEIIRISINEVPEANPTSNSPICEGETILLETDELVGADYAWTGPDGFTSTDQNPTITNVTTLNSGDYELTVTLNGCSSDPAVVNVVVEETPESIPDAVATEICEGDDIELLANDIVGADYAWTGPNGFTSTDQNPIIPNATTIHSGDYELTITLGNCVSEVGTVNINVIDAPSINTVPNAPICEGDDLLFQTDVVTGSSYEWTGPNGFSSTESSPTIPNVTVDASGTYELTVIVGTCSANETIDVVINPTPTVSYDAQDVLCNGDNSGSISITATGNNPLTYTWDPAVSSNETAENLAAGTYVVTVSDANTCSTTETITISEPDALQATTSSTPSQCTVPSGSATIDVTGGTGSYTYEWENSIGGLFSETAENVLAGTYEVVVTDENGCSITETIQINTIDGPQVVVQATEDITCFGDDNGSISVSVSGGTPGYTYNWSPSQAPSITNELSDLSPGEYSLTVTDEAGCEGTISVTINEPTALGLDMVVNDANCGISNGSITANVTGGTGMYTYDWTPTSGGGNQINNLTAGDYAITVTDENGCEISEEITVNTTGGIDMFVDPESATINYDQSIDLDAYVDEDIENFDITWTPDATLSCNDCLDPTATPGVSTTYYVTVTTPDGCTATDSIVITVIPPCGELFVPDMFSPNGDGNNDLLCFYGGCPVKFEIEIFNRWGEIVYQSNESQICWDGTYRDKPLNTGIYAYKLVYQLQGETEETLTNGNITLVR